MTFITGGPACVVKAKDLIILANEGDDAEMTRYWEPYGDIMVREVED